MDALMDGKKGNRKAAVVAAAMTEGTRFPSTNATLADIPFPYLWGLLRKIGDTDIDNKVVSQITAGGSTVFRKGFQHCSGIIPLLSRGC